MGGGSMLPANGLDGLGGVCLTACTSADLPSPPQTCGPGAAIPPDDDALSAVAAAAAGPARLRRLLLSQQWERLLQCAVVAMDRCVQCRGGGGGGGHLMLVRMALLLFSPQWHAPLLPPHPPTLPPSHPPCHAPPPAEPPCSLPPASPPGSPSASTQRSWPWTQRRCTTSGEGCVCGGAGVGGAG